MEDQQSKEQSTQESESADLTWSLVYKVLSTPRVVMTQILKQNPSFLKSQIIVVYLALAMLPQFILLSRQSIMNALMFLLVFTIFYPIAIVIFIYLGSFMLWLTGKLLKGKASQRHIRTVFVWNFVPSIIISAIMGVLTIVFAIDITDMAILQKYSTALIGMGVVYSLYYIVYTCQTLGSAQHFSGFRAFVNYFLSFALLIIPILILLFIFKESFLEALKHSPIVTGETLQLKNLYPDLKFSSAKILETHTNFRF